MHERTNTEKMFLTKGYVDKQLQTRANFDKSVLDFS